MHCIPRVEEKGDISIHCCLYSHQVSLWTFLNIYHYFLFLFCVGVNRLHLNNRSEKYFDVTLGNIQSILRRLYVSNSHRTFALRKKRTMLYMEAPETRWKSKFHQISHDRNLQSNPKRVSLSQGKMLSLGPLLPYLKTELLLASQSLKALMMSTKD